MMRLTSSPSFNLSIFLSFSLSLYLSISLSLSLSLFLYLSIYLSINLSDLSISIHPMASDKSYDPGNRTQTVKGDTM